jgi:hypothetical protein
MSLGGVESIRRAISIVASSRSGFLAMPNPWDVPPISKIPTDYDIEEQALYKAVGSALSSWQYVEDAIASIFKALVSDGLPEHTYEPSRSPAERAYGSVISFEARATMVAEAAEAFFYKNPHPDYEKQLREILKACRGWSARRNDIAHGKIAGSPLNYFVGKPSDWNRCALWPSSSNTRKVSLDNFHSFIYTSKIIDGFEKQFWDLHDKLFKFEGEFLCWRRGQRGEHPWQDHLHPNPEQEDQK